MLDAMQWMSTSGNKAHADQKDLPGWQSHFRKPSEKTFLVQGELSSSNTMA